MKPFKSIAIALIALIAIAVSLPLTHAAAHYAGEHATITKTHAVATYSSIALTDASNAACLRTQRLAVRTSGQQGCWSRDSESTIAIK